MSKFTSNIHLTLSNVSNNVNNNTINNRLNKPIRLYKMTQFTQDQMFFKDIPRIYSLSKADKQGKKLMGNMNFAKFFKNLSKKHMETKCNLGLNSNSMELLDTDKFEEKEYDIFREDKVFNLKKFKETYKKMINKEKIMQKQRKENMCQI